MFLCSSVFMKITDRQLAIVLHELCAGAQSGNELEARVKVFVQYLGQNALIHRSDRIEEALKEVALEAEGKQTVTIESPYELSDETVGALQKALKLEKSVPKFEKNTELIGGAIAKTKDTIYDLSLKKQLEKLAQSLL